jgi:hypothetical protein
MAEIVECLTSKHKALSSNPSTGKQKKNKQTQIKQINKNPTT